MKIRSGIVYKNTYMRNHICPMCYGSSMKKYKISSSMLFKWDKSSSEKRSLDQCMYQVSYICIGEINSRISRKNISYSIHAMGHMRKVFILRRKRIFCRPKLSDGFIKTRLIKTKVIEMNCYKL